ncbi:MAG: hypothetical protein H7246_20485 [Phycisphaerae bacterium]|nr:hypothetical protein [Saprospiraceae bacterium]
MNAKILLATLAGGVTAFLVGWLVWGMLLDPYYRTMYTPEALSVQRAPEDMILWGIIASNLVSGLLLALIYSRWANISTFKGGAIAGAVICALVALSFDLGMYSFMKMWTSTTFLIIDPLVNAIFGAIVGGVVGWVLGYGDKR